MEIDETLWYHEQGFFNNPFSIKPAAFHDEMFGSEEELRRITNNIELGRVCLIIGEYGTGKTTFLKKAMNNFRGQKRIVYYSCNRREGVIEFDKLLKNRTWFNKLFGIKAKNMILLLDEMQELNPVECDVLVDYYKNSFFKSIILVTKDKRKIKLTPELKKLIDKNVFELRKINAQEAIQLVRKRLDDVDFLPSDVIKKIHQLNPNPRAILENCEDACRNAFEDGSEVVLEKHVRAIKQRKR